MQQTLSGRFRSAVVALVPGQVNLVDSANLTSSWTEGATLVDLVTAQPNFGQVWDIASWSISFNGMMVTSIFANTPPSGRLGKVLGGLTIGGVSATLTQTPSLRPWVNPAQPLPSGIQNFATMWDGQTDAPFPQALAGATSFPSAVPVAFTNQLPLPVTAAAGEQIAICLTLTPSLSQAVVIALWNAQYVITYERRTA